MAYIVYKAYTKNQVNRVKGKELETTTKLELTQVIKKCGGSAYTNIYIPLYGGNSTEVDVAYIVKNCVFLIECKNYNAIVDNHNDIDSEYWVANYGSKWFKFRSPILQSRGHVRALKKYLINRRILNRSDISNLNIISLVVFSNNTKFSNTLQTSTQNGEYVIHQNDICTYIQNIVETQSLNDRTIEPKLSKVFNTLTEVNILDKVRHIVFVKKQQIRRNLQQIR